ncbi:hypothetical protein IW262DRAFT_1301530 [Armillaria fumosa]|nr:hypothetical protein IW262DRAFT_1301530 [Armillaria fumosa]
MYLTHYPIYGQESYETPPELPTRDLQSPFSDLERRGRMPSPVAGPFGTWHSSEDARTTPSFEGRCQERTGAKPLTDTYNRDFEEELEVERLLSPTPLEPAHSPLQPRSTAMTQGSMQSFSDDAYKSATSGNLATTDEEDQGNRHLHSTYDRERRIQMSSLEIPTTSDDWLVKRSRAVPSTWGLQTELGHPSPYPSECSRGPTGPTAMAVNIIYQMVSIDRKLI